MGTPPGNFSKGETTTGVAEDAKIVEKKGKEFPRFKHRDETTDAPLRSDGTKCRLEIAE